VRLSDAVGAIFYPKIKKALLQGLFL